MKLVRAAVALSALASVTFVSGTAFAQSQPLKSGEQIYKETCVVCHGTGLLAAPKLADNKAWAELIKEPQAVLTADGWVGVRNMPAKGGRPDLSLEEFSRAVAYMARAVGAKWADPDAALMKQIQAEEKKALDKKAKEAKETKGKK